MCRWNNTEYSHYFIYDLWYGDPFRQIALCLQSLFRSIHCNWLWCGIRTLQGSKKALLWTSWIICIYYVHMHPRYCAERYMRYSISIRHINQTVAYIKQFCFKKCSVIPDGIIITYHTLKIIRPWGMVSHQSCWI